MRTYDALVLIDQECHRAMEKHPPMHSPHEAYAVILEEVDEFWGAVMGSQDRANMREELIQIGAMAVRALHDLQLLEDS